MCLYTLGHVPYPVDSSMAAMEPGVRCASALRAERRTGVSTVAPHSNSSFIRRVPAQVKFESNV